MVLPLVVAAVAVGGYWTFRAASRALSHPAMRNLGSPPEGAAAAAAADHNNRLVTDARAPMLAFQHSMDMAEARKILHVGSAATSKEIVNAHRILLRRNHPDRGGSTYVCAKLNEAKELLVQKGVYEPPK
eukprot:TRINITY_DN34272_c0_g1_i1.p1 TRINITY_DN34272_c0_g1~~TRINITY_DN34272_c0_g1_i1.p1  ORF type:complete len:130 (-),score=10.71 TRINITY_DN34272_c0_g1_i1:73-462(-)